MDGTLTMTDAVIRQHGIAAQDAYEEAGRNLAALIFQLKTVGKRHAHIAALIGAIELDPKDPIRSEAPLFMLSPGDFEGIDLDAIRELTNAIVMARRNLTDTRTMARSLGRNV